MTDDELRRQLERRAGPPAGDIVRHELLPAVSTAIREDVARPVGGRGMRPVAAFVAFASVVVLVVGLAIVRAPSPPSPAASATPERSVPPSAKVDCVIPSLPAEGSASPVRSGAPTVNDRTGEVESCRLELDPVPLLGRAVLVEKAGDADRHLRVYWEGTPCDANARIVFAALGGEHYIVLELPDDDCEAMLVAHAVVLTLAAPVSATDIAIRSVRVAANHDAGIASRATSVGSFTLRLTAPRSSYVAGEPIEGIAAELTYEGEQEVVGVAGVGQLIPGFRTEMLDGPYATGPGWDLPCERDQIRRGVAIVQPYQKNGGWDPQGPLAEFYSDFFADPQLRLPAGTWRITAYSVFSIGDCGGEPVHLEASIVLDVVEDTRSPAAPSPSASASASPAASMSPLPTVAPTPVREPLPTPFDGQEPYWELAPTERPTATSESIDVFVYESRCTSGQSPEGRITGADVIYGDESVTITVQIRPLRGAQSCEGAPPAEFTVELEQPLGNRRLVDGGSGLWAVWEHSDDFLGLTVNGSPTYYAERRLASRTGRDCALNLDGSRERPTRDEAEAMANEAPEGYGLVGGGRAWLGDWRDAVHAFGAVEAYGSESEWLFMGIAAGQAWLHVELPAGTPFITDIYPIEVSGGRTLWVPNVDRLWIAPADDEECRR